MADKRPEGIQIPAILPFAPYVQESFDLNRADAFVKSLGAEFYHWKASPSPIGLNEKGDYRRNNGDVDVLTSNGYVYSYGGKFTATMTGNQKDQIRPSQGGLIDASTAHLVMPRFYDDDSDATVSGSAIPGSDCCPTPAPCVDLPLQVGPLGEDCCENNGNGSQGKRIRLTPGDRLYHDPTVDDLVVNKELMNYNFNGPNIPMFPIVQMDGPIVDSLGRYYTVNVNFTICNGNIIWTPGQPNPGIDPDTGEGRTYSIRYLYRAFYYVTRLLREVRITEVTEGDIRRPERMPYYVEITREYLFLNINRGDVTNKPPIPAMEKRQVVEPADKVPINTGIVRVETTDLDNDT